MFGAGHRASLVRYVGLAATLLTLNVVLLEALSAATGSSLIAKIATEVLLVAARYLIQRRYMFRRRVARPDPGDSPAGTAPARPVPIAAR